MLRIFAGALLITLLGAASPDSNVEANKLFVEAVQLIGKAREHMDRAEAVAEQWKGRQSNEPGYNEAFRLVRTANDTSLVTGMAAEQLLRDIIDKYPGSNLAVQLASGQRVGTISLSALTEAGCKSTALRLEALASALDLFFLDAGRYPTASENLNALVIRPSGISSWNGPYLVDGFTPTDAWGKPFIYMRPTDRPYTLTSGAHVIRRNCSGHTIHPPSPR